jgi:hypothetical protein
MLCSRSLRQQGKNQTHLVQERSAMNRNRSRLVATLADTRSVTHVMRRKNKLGLKFALSVVTNPFVTEPLLLKTIGTDETDHA